ncbi:MAG: DUF4345 domain-containing protein [Gammaproteobacteria bacterium]|jgi:hypothetical protein
MSRIFLLACGVLYLGFGLWVVLSPETSLAYMEISPYSTNALSDLRGSHGGLNIAVGLFFLYAAGSSQWHRTGLLAVALLNIGYFSGRLIALGAEGLPSATVIAVMVLEVFLLTTAMVLVRKTPGTA